MLTINLCRDDLLSKLGIPDASVAPVQALNDCWQSMNYALQVLQTAGEYYFTRQKLACAFSAGTAVFSLPQTIQSIIGPGRWNDTIPLRAIVSRGEYDQFDRIFLGSASFGVNSGVPMAYFVEDVRVGNVGDVVQTNIYLCPRPALAGTLYIDVIPDTIAYGLADFNPGTALIPVAQNYTESVFLPIARWNITRSAYFSRPDIQPSLKDDYDRAMAHLISVGGFPDIGHPDPARVTDA